MAKLSSTQIYGDLQVDGQIKNKATTTTEGVVQLSSATNSTSTTLAATASAVKAAYDLAAGKAAATHTHNYAGSSSAGGAATSALACTGNSATATKLATARTINGTNFDGSAAITTANWGTARTITIGSTGKSVNGSANVSWSLAEIGAAAASHTHNYAGSSSAGGAATSALACTGNSATATTLQTARTINGTSFNGSANITTANWGTGRTITIGSTGKSVNGSANVSWTLAEIGAAAASHTHSNYVPTSTGGNITIHADSDASTTTEYIMLKAGHNELKVTTSGGGTTVTQGQDKLTFNGNVVYHAGKKPTPADIGAVPTSASCNKNWNWSGQSGQPSWLWGGNDSSNMYVYNPSNFRVANANTVGDVGIGGLARYYQSNGSVNIADTNLKQFYGTCVTSNSSAPSTDWWHIINVPHSDNNGYGGQLAIGYHGNPYLYVRSAAGTSWGSWAQVYTSVNKPTPAAIGAAAVGHSHASNTIYFEDDDKYIGCTLMRSNGSLIFSGKVKSGTSALAFKSTLITSSSISDYVGAKFAEPTLKESWTKPSSFRNYDSAYVYNSKYTLMVNADVVTIHGYFQTTASSAYDIFTLPSGYIPRSTISIQATIYDGTSYYTTSRPVDLQISYSSGTVSFGKWMYFSTSPVTLYINATYSIAK